MLAHIAQAELAAIDLEHRCKVPADDVGARLKAGIARIGAGRQIAGGPSWQPGLAIAAAPDHGAIGSRRVQRGRDVIKGLNIAIDDDGNAHGIFHFSDK
jgi:hypothetical protein